MTDADRKTLGALADDENELCTTTVDERAAIRSALAEIDALHESLGAQQSRVTNLVSRITGKPGNLSNESVGEACREANRLRAEVADLQTRAIPQRLVEAPLLTIAADFDDRVETITRVAASTRNGWVHDADYHDGRQSVLSPAYPTLADALRAASEET